MPAAGFFLGVGAFLVFGFAMSGDDTLPSCAMHRLSLVVMLGCSAPAVHAPATAPGVIDRFSPAAGHLMVRGTKPLPAPGAPIDFDRRPFITQAFGPDGRVVRYYHFDVQSPVPATLWRATRAGEHAALSGQLDIVDAIPGEPGYSDFFRIAWVEVPADFVPGSAHARADLAQFPTTLSTKWIDCPIVPHGSTARESATPVQLAYRGATIDCLRFGDEADLDGERVPTSPIYVTFGTEGFKREGETPQTHNVVLSVPGDTDYSPLWDVHVYDARAFARVHDAATAQRARLAEHGPLVNCPIVFVAP